MALLAPLSYRTSQLNSQLIMEDCREVGEDFCLSGGKESSEYGRNHMSEPVVNIGGVKRILHLYDRVLFKRSSDLGEREVDHGLD